MGREVEGVVGKGGQGTRDALKRGAGSAGGACLGVRVGGREVARELRETVEGNGGGDGASVSPAGML